MCSRINADHFVVLRKSDEEKHFNECLEYLMKGLQEKAEKPILLHRGVFEVEDTFMDVATIYDRALLALRNVKHSSSERLGGYNDCLY